MDSRLTRIVALLGALLAVANGCGDDDDQAATGTTTTVAAATSSISGAGTTTGITTTTTTTTTTIPIPVDVEVTQDLPYTSQRIVDVYAPAEGSGWPVMVHFHGGQGSPEQWPEFARAIAEQGVVVFVPGWASLGPDGGSEDTICALAFATDHAEEYGGDPDRIVPSGYSTGGYTAVVHALVGDDPPLPVTDCAVDPTIDASEVVVGGGAPLFAADAARSGLLDANPQWNSLTPEQIDAFDPSLVLGRNPELRVRLVVGEDDVGGTPGVPFPIAESNRDYHAELLEAGYDSELTEVPGGHLDPITPGTESWDTYVATIVEAARGT
jgi:acetyl esterase/lipase